MGVSERVVSLVYLVYDHCFQNDRVWNVECFWKSCSNGWPTARVSGKLYVTFLFEQEFRTNVGNCNFSNTTINEI